MAGVPGTKWARPPQSKLIASQLWQPPQGWVARAPGVWVPNDYSPTRWEIQAPPVHNFDEAAAEYYKCSQSYAYFAFNYVWTLDVDDPAGTSVRKVPAYPYVRRSLDALQVPSNVVFDKSRQMFVSWLMMIVFLADVLFRRNYAGLVLSKRSKDVDDGGVNSTPDSNLGKLRFMHSRLPEFLWTPFEYKTFQVRNPAMNSHITGETGKGGKAARGPAYNRALMDEAAYVEHSETVFSGIRQAAKRGTVMVSTPNGMANTFARIRHSTTTTFLKLTAHWSEHPRKSIGLYCVCGWRATPGGGKSPRDQYSEHAPICPRLTMDPPKSPEMRSPWYDRETSDMTPEKVASDLDISYQASRRGRVYTFFDQTRNVWPIYHRLGPRRVDETNEEYLERYLRLAIDPRYQCFTCWDFGVGDPTSVLFGQIIDDATPRVRFLDELEYADKSYDFFGDYVHSVWKKIAFSVGNRLSFQHYGGQDVKNRDSKLESWFSNLKLHRDAKKEGIFVQQNANSTGGGMLEWIDYINNLYRHGFVQVSEWCKGQIDATNNYHYPLDANGEPIPGIHLPVHDEFSHKMDAKRYLFRVRYAGKLMDRNNKAISTKRILRRGGGYDIKTETRIF